MVRIFHRDSGDEVVSFDPGDPFDFCPALRTIWDTPKLSDEQKSFASFWTGYFYANTGGGEVG